MSEPEIARASVSVLVDLPTTSGVEIVRTNTSAVLNPTFPTGVNVMPGDLVMPLLVAKLLLVGLAIGSGCAFQPQMITQRACGTLPQASRPLSLKDMKVM